MKKIIFLLLCLCLLIGCYKERSSSNEETVITSHEHRNLKIEFTKTEHAIINNEYGSIVQFMIHDLSGEPLNAQNYSFSLQNPLEIDGQVYEARNTMIETTPSGDILFTQFYTPNFPKKINSLPMIFTIKPLYYQKEVIFQNLSNGMQNVSNNDLEIVDLKIENNQLSIAIKDIHPIIGLKVVMLSGEEEIYPTFSKTDYHEQANMLVVQNTYTHPIQEPITVKMTRHRLIEIIWNLPFIVTQ